jgi:hypothetical protein
MGEALDAAATRAANRGGLFLRRCALPVRLGETRQPFCKFIALGQSQPALLHLEIILDHRCVQGGFRHPPACGASVSPRMIRNRLPAVRRSSRRCSLGLDRGAQYSHRVPLGRNRRCPYPETCGGALRGAGVWTRPGRRARLAGACSAIADRCLLSPDKRRRSGHFSNRRFVPKSAISEERQVRLVSVVVRERRLKLQSCHLLKALPEPLFCWPPSSAGAEARRPVVKAPALYSPAISRRCRQSLAGCLGQTQAVDSLGFGDSGAGRWKLRPNSARCYLMIDLSNSISVCSSSPVAHPLSKPAHRPGEVFKSPRVETAPLKYMSYFSYGSMVRL